MRHTRRVAAIAIATSMVVIAACGSDDDGGIRRYVGAHRIRRDGRHRRAGRHRRTRHRQRGAAPEGLVNGEIPCDQQYAGKTVSVLSPVRNSENDPDAIQIFTDFWQPLVDCTGVKIDFQGTDQFEVQAPVLLQGGSPPDVIDFPQPGLLPTLARQT